MPQIGNWVWDDTNKVWVKLAGTAAGAMSIHAIVDALNDITDVNVPSPTDQQGIEWDTATSKWILVKYIRHALLTTRGDIIYRNATVPARLAKGTSGQYLKQGADDPAWATLAAADIPALDTAKITTGAFVIARMPANVPIASITFIIDGGGSAITTGQKGHLEIPFGCTINQVTMLADQSGSIVVDIWKDTYANFPPTVADTITAAAKPTIAAAQNSQDSTLTGWTTAIAAGDILAYNVDSITTCQRVTISLKVTKT